MPNALVETGTPASFAAAIAWVSSRPTVVWPSDSSTMRAGGASSPDSPRLVWKFWMAVSEVNTASPMAVDVSLSMQATDIEPSRFEAMQRAAKQFVDVLPARINLGLVSFAGTATTLVTPTTDRGQVRSAIDNLDLAESTAIGEAVFTSLTAIENYQSALNATEEELPPARIVLLSDGYNTVGRDDTQAIDAAVDAGVPVSTIAFGTDYGTLDLDGERVPVPVDRATLEEIAEETGGSYSEAASAAELEQVYEDLGSQIGYTVEPRDVSYWFVRGGVLLALVGVVLSLLWTNRLV